MSDNSDTGLDETGQMSHPFQPTTPLFENPYTPGDIPADASFADVHAMTEQVDSHTRNIPDTSTPPEPSAPPAPEPEPVPEPTMADVRRLQQQADAHIAKISTVDSPSDTIFKIGDSVKYFKLKAPNYSTRYDSYRSKTGEILLVHYDDYPPLYYTVRFPDGSEVQTIGKYLTIIPRSISSPKKVSPKKVTSKEVRVPYNSKVHTIARYPKVKSLNGLILNKGDEVIWIGEGLPNNSIIIGDTPTPGVSWVDIYTNTGRRISVPKTEINHKNSPLIQSADKAMTESLDGLHWEETYLYRRYGNNEDFNRSIVSVLAWLSIPAPPKPSIGWENDFAERLIVDTRRNDWNLYRKFKYEWKNEDVFRSQIKELARKLYGSNWARFDDNDIESDLDNKAKILLLQIISNKIGRTIHLITTPDTNLNVITVTPDKTISAEELYVRMASHGDTVFPDSHPIWIKHTPEGYVYSERTKTDIYTPREGGYYPGDDDIPSRLITNKEKNDATEVIRKYKQGSTPIRLGTPPAANKPQGCCGGSARSHRKRKTRKTRKMLKNRKKIKKTNHKRGRKTKTRNPRKTRKFRR
jgi:hypothetical protein